MGQHKHTPGPWRAFNGFDVFPDDDDTTGSRHIADCDPVDDAIPPEERRANAFLIAAAPDLLEAARAMASAIGNAPTISVDAAEKLALAAIAKATGGDA